MVASLRNQPILFVLRDLLQNGKLSAFGFTTQWNLVQIRLMQPVIMKRASVFEALFKSHR